MFSMKYLHATIRIHYIIQIFHLNTKSLIVGSPFTHDP